MVEYVQVVSVPVSDRDRAKSFYTYILVYEQRTENVFAPGMRWLG